MILLLPILAAVVHAQYPVHFANCGGNLPATITQVLIDQKYDGDVPTVTFYAVGQSSVEISAGTGRTTGTILGTEVFRDQGDVCGYLGGCPRAPGQVQAVKTIKADNLNKIWGVDIVGKMEWFDANADLIGCVETKFAIMKNGDAETIANSIIYAIAVGSCVIAISASGTVYMISSQGTTAVTTVGGAPVPSATPPVTSPSFVDMMLYMQFLSETGMMNLDMPNFYSEIVAKFSWTNFMPSVDFLIQFTEQIRSSTGQPQVPIVIQPLPPIPVDPTYDPNLDRGLSQLARIIGIKKNDLFIYTTVVFFFVVLVWAILAILIRLCAELYFSIRLMSQLNKQQQEESRVAFRTVFTAFVLGNVVRIFYLGLFALVTTSIFQMTLSGDHWGVYLWAGIVLGLFCIGITLALTIYLVRYRNNPKALYEDRKKYLLFGAFYNNYTEIAYMFFVVFITYRIVSGVVIGGTYFSAVAQMALLLLTECVYLFVLAVKRPLNTKFANKLHIWASIMRVMAAFLLITFIPGLGVDSRSAAIIGYVVLGLNGLAILCYSAVMARNLVSAVKKAKKNEEKHNDENILMTETSSNETFFAKPVEKLAPEEVEVKIDMFPQERRRSSDDITMSG